MNILREGVLMAARYYGHMSHFNEMISLIYVNI